MKVKGGVNSGGFALTPLNHSIQIYPDDLLLISWDDVDMMD